MESNELSFCTKLVVHYQFCIKDPSIRISKEKKEAPQTYKSFKSCTPRNKMVSHPNSRGTAKFAGLSSIMV